MKAPIPKCQRCAIYTRKSTEHNLDLAFNSLDAQREACEAYIKSQAHEGWRLIPQTYDDGGLSGASLERPALQVLLNAVRAKKIDIIVVYKVDRLTRSLADFAKLVELFDEYQVSFVSITQSFNTTSSMGRLTLNVLLSFAQFEREVIGERVRDKIAASKRKGIWVGGPVPLGYRNVNKKLEIIAEEADLVRKIFADYLRLGSVGALAASLNREGIQPKPRSLASGRTIAPQQFMVGPLAHILKNRFYIGEVAYRDEIHPGSHEPILDRQTFDAVQARLTERAVARSKLRAPSPALLTGRIFDERGNPMSPTHANKKGVRYRYYTSHALLQGRRDDAGSIPRVSAPHLESVVLDALSVDLGNIEAVADLQAVQQRIVKVIVARNLITIRLSDDPESEDAVPVVKVPFAPYLRPRKGIACTPSNTRTIDDQTRTVLLTAIARSRSWIDKLMSTEGTTLADIAASEKLVERHVRFLAPLAYLSPRIVEAIFDGRAPADLTVSRFARDLPKSWTEQERSLDIA